MWVQFLGLGMHLRNEKCLRILAGKLGKVLFVDNSVNLAEKTARLRVKVLVQDYTKIPERIRIGLDGSMDHKILVKGQPTYCLCCREPRHSAKSCSKKPDSEGWKTVQRKGNSPKRPSDWKRTQSVAEGYAYRSFNRTRPTWREIPKENTRPVEA